MAYLIIIAVALALFIGFFMLTGYEARRGTRVWAPLRSRLDQNVTHAQFIFAHIDLAAFVRAEVNRLGSRIGHDIAHLSLQAVRAVERLLTRAVRHLRMRQAADTAPRPSAREFVKTLSDFKGHLEATRPEMPDVHEVH